MKGWSPNEQSQEPVESQVDVQPDFPFALFLITGIAEPEFLSYSNIISCFNTATMYTLLAIGIAFVIMTGEIDVSIGSTLGLSAAMTGLIAKQDGSIAVMLLAVLPPAPSLA